MWAGAVLAGGQSRRFGSNKALQEFRGRRLIDHCVDGLRPFADPMLVVANDLSLYADVQATLIQDVLPHQGPLGGIYTALLFSPRDWVFVKATDMPFLVPELLTTLAALRRAADVVVPVVEERYEPLFAFYHRRCLPAIGATLAASGKKIVEFYRRIRVHSVKETEWRRVDAEGRSFWNVNTPDDWQSMLTQ